MVWCSQTGISCIMRQRCDNWGYRNWSGWCWWLSARCAAPTAAPSIPTINRSPTALHPAAPPSPIILPRLYYVMCFVRLSRSHLLGRCAGRWSWLAANRLAPSKTQAWCPPFTAVIPCLSPDCLSYLFFLFCFSVKIFVQHSMYCKYTMNTNVVNR